jgi:PleD family two-component response regulator
MKVLIVHDDELARALLVEILEKLGHDVHELSSPIGATSVMLKEKVDVVVLEMMMSSLNGDKLAKLMKGSPQLRRVGVVLVSATEDQSMRDLAKAAGAAFVGKSQLRTRLGDAVVRAASANAQRVT